MPRDYDRDMELFELKYEAWRESEYEKYCEKQYDLLHAPANIQQQGQTTTPAPEEKPAPVGQTRRGSLLESPVNILVGYSVNFTANLLIFPLFGWHISARENLTLGVIYTGISLVRSYGLRRLFNHKDLKK